MKYFDPSIAEKYLNHLITVFDRDGITDRRMEYKRTIEFVNDRSKILLKELELIEKKKEDFKRQNKLSDIKVDADLTINQQYNYDSELFLAMTQKDFIKLLNEELEVLTFDLLPVNFGISDQNLNQLIYDYNSLIVKRNDLITSGAGLKNSLIKNLEFLINESFSNLKKSSQNFEKSINLTIKNINEKEREFEVSYADIPENEKILRAIERELEIKEALYLLLLQKKEEAAINFAVIRPTIKIIDSPRSTVKSISPNNKIIIVTSLIISIIFPILIISFLFYFDDKIHVSEDLADLDINILSEIPYSKELINNTINFDHIKDDSRLPLIEGIRMLIANLKFSLFNNQNTVNKILVTSSVKGEGKTIISFSLAKVISFTDKKVILIGSDLRNPQLHKYVGKTRKDIKGISNLIYNKNLKWKDLVVKSGNLDILFSGTIPPNPSEMLLSEGYKNLISEVSKNYDYVIVDSAPLLLVADTLQISKYFDLSICVVRSNFSSKTIKPYLTNLKSNSRLKNISLVLNGVGSSSKYAYKYNYKYAYNYGYGYGYDFDNND